MGIIPKVTCRSCGRQFATTRVRCPYCGAQREKQSNRAPVSTVEAKPETAANRQASADARWQLIFGMTLLCAVVLAVIVLITVSLNARDKKEVPDTSGGDIVETQPGDIIGPVRQEPPEAGSTEPEAPPAPVATSVTISYYNTALSEFTTGIGAGTPLMATVYPTDVVAKVEWSSSDDSIAKVTADSETTCVVTGVGSGMAYIYAVCGDITATCKVYVR